MKKSEWAAVAAGAAVVVVWGAKRLWDRLPWHTPPQELDSEGKAKAVPASGGLYEAFTGEPGEEIEITRSTGEAIRDVSMISDSGPKNPPRGFGGNIMGGNIIGGFRPGFRARFWAKNAMGGVAESDFFNTSQVSGEDTKQRFIMELERAGWRYVGGNRMRKGVQAEPMLGHSSKSDVRYWHRAVFRQSYTRNGQSFLTKAWARLRDRLSKDRW